MIYKYIKINQKIISCILTLLMPSMAFSEICTDDYVISGVRLISLLPDIPFEIFENNSILIVRRGTMTIKFINPIEVYEEEKKIIRYSTFLIGDEYFFELIGDGEGKERKWRQYSSGSHIRGFGGVCRLE